MPTMSRDVVMQGHCYCFLPFNNVSSFAVSLFPQQGAHYPLPGAWFVVSDSLPSSR